MAVSLLYFSNEFDNPLPGVILALGKVVFWGDANKRWFSRPGRPAEPASRAGQGQAGWALAG